MFVRAKYPNSIDRVELRCIFPCPLVNFSLFLNAGFHLGSASLARSSYDKVAQQTFDVASSAALARAAALG